VKSVPVDDRARAAEILCRLAGIAGMKNANPGRLTTRQWVVFQVARSIAEGGELRFDPAEMPEPALRALGELLAAVASANDSAPATRPAGIEAWLTHYDEVLRERGAVVSATSDVALLVEDIKRALDNVADAETRRALNNWLTVVQFHVRTRTSLTDDQITTIRGAIDVAIAIARLNDPGGDENV
jgi:hypothetical protein